MLGSPNNVSVNGTTPTGSLTSLYGKAQTVEFTYNPGNTVATGTISIGASTGSNSNAMAFIVISNNANPNASGAQIFFQFLSESVLVSIFGGFLGLFVGRLFTEGISMLTREPAVVTPGTIINALIFAAGTGLFFGMYPAIRASRLNPIEALRTE